MEEIFSNKVLKDKVTIMTGGGRGLGRVMARALARAGSVVVLTARSRDEIDRTADEISDMGGKALAITADVTKSDDLVKMVDRVIGTFGRVDVLVNNAGQNASFANYKFEEIPEKAWVEMIHTNVNGVFLASKIVGKAMLDRRSGKIINIASSFGVKAIPTRICYTVSKAAVIQMTRSLAVEWADRGITVNCLAPGSFDLFPDSQDEGYLKMNQERTTRVPLGRLGRPEELGPLLVYLASDVSNYMSGMTIFMDGGMTAT